MTRQSCSAPPGYAIAPGVSCCSVPSTTSVRVPRCLAARVLNVAGDGAERLVVRAGFPRRVDGRAERVHVGMHVGAGQVGLLVPGGRGQHDIRQQGCRRHPEVDRHEQVELALRDVVGPGDVVGPQCIRGRAAPAGSRWCRAGAAGSTRCPCSTNRAGWPARRSAPVASSPDCRDRSPQVSGHPRRAVRLHRKGSRARRRGPRRRYRGWSGRTVDRTGVQPIAAAEASTSIVCLPANRRRPSGLASASAR